MAMSQYQIRQKIDELRQRLNAHERQGHLLEEGLAALERQLQVEKPKQPYAGSIVAFIKVFPGDERKFRYAAMRYGEFWYITQNGERALARLPRMTWSELLTFVGPENYNTISVMTSWRRLIND